SPAGGGGLGWGRAVRLGLRQIKGLAEADADQLVAYRPRSGYADPRDLWRRSGLGGGALERLADADAFRSIGLDRRRALWALKALGEPPLPLFAAAETLTHQALRAWSPLSRTAGEGADPRITVRGEAGEGTVSEAHAMQLLPEMPLGEHVVEDYASLSLTLKRHPLAFLRAELAREGLVTAAELAHLPVGRRLAIAGIVLIRQRPGSANGVVFITIEDETGIANLIVWPQILERFRRAALGATLLRCTGKLQREESVIHIVADRLEDMTPRLNTLRDRAGETDYRPDPHPSLPRMRGRVREGAFSPPAKPPGYDPRDIVIISRNFR
ncbi:MAG TPA: OB-fold nucleic acid binding domain-containing protein, partial [Stellaceae bacterium]|nr:OB-fold nucleic acid binding domain-containing protein [Stellaceae bacterium]